MTKAKKFLLVLPLLIALFFTAFMASACGEQAQPEDSSTHVSTFAQLKSALQNGGAIILDGDIKEVKEQLVVSKNVTLNLNGKTISSAESLVYDGDNGVWSLFVVRGATLTVTGNGKVEATKIFTFSVQSEYEGDSVTAQNNKGVASSKLVIENGHFISGGGDVSTQGTVVYVAGAGSRCEIKGGEFETTTTDHNWVLNTMDESETDASLFSVTGGTFHDFDPAATFPNGSHDTHSHVAADYKSEKVDSTNNYRVVPNED